MPQAYSDDAKAAKYDAESAPGMGESYDNELRRKKRIKFLLYGAAFVVFQTGIILIFILVIMKLRTPEYRVEMALLQSSNSRFGTAQDPSFKLKMNGELSVRNANFGTYKFDDSKVFFYYGDQPVGEAEVSISEVGWRKTKLVSFSVDLSSNDLPNIMKSQLGNDLGSRALTLNSKSKLNGKVAMMFIFKKEKAIDMDCALTIGVADKMVRQISCK